jgi:hypothetical protein
VQSLAIRTRSSTTASTARAASSSVRCAHRLVPSPSIHAPSSTRADCVRCTQTGIPPATM